MKPVFVLIILWLCFKSEAQTLDTLTQLNEFKSKKAFYKAPNGNVYKIKVVKSDWTDSDSEGKDVLSLNCLDSLYKGHDRDTAKTTIVKGSTLVVATISELIKLLPSDSIMRKKVKKKDLRIPDENRNVRLKKDTYLYAFAKEEDGDYHLIIGDHVKLEKATFFNAEISGLPTNKSRKALSTVRKTFDSRFLDLCTSDYVVFENPIKIDIQGSLFFDISHTVGQVDPAKMKPQTNWEIHPVVKIIFLD